jgi:hypothetical protein
MACDSEDHQVKSGHVRNHKIPFLFTAQPTFLRYILDLPKENIHNEVRGGVFRMACGDDNCP